MKFFGRPSGAVKPVKISKPSDDDLPKVPPVKKWIVEFLDGSVFEVWAHTKEIKDGMNRFQKITGFWWRDYSWIDERKPWQVKTNWITVNEIPTSAVKMIRQG